MPKNKKLNKKLKNKLVKIAAQQLKDSINFKQERMEDIKLNENMYYGESLPRLKGRFSVPLPTMPGFVDTLHSKVDEEPTINFSSEDPADRKGVEKASALMRKIQKQRDQRWGMKDRSQKKMAIFSGRGIARFFTESDPDYKNHFIITDHYDFQCEPLGGGYLENHRFLGEMNVFKDAYDLEQGVEGGLYDKDQVQKLKNSQDNKSKKKNVEVFKNKVHRFEVLGMNPEDKDFVGDEIYPLVEWGLTYKGNRYYLLFDFTTETWIRVEKLEDMFESKLWPWVSWATHHDEFVFWSKAPADDIRPVAVGMDIIFNQALDNRQKRNFGQRAYDPNVFPDPEELEWRPDGLVRANITQNKNISQGIYEFQTPEIAGTIDMIEFMDQYLALKTGITAEAQGESDEKKVGIHFSNLQSVADRLGVYNKSYSEFHADMGHRFLWGAKEHLPDDGIPIKLIGTKGVESTKILKEDINPDIDVNITGGQAELRANEVKSRKRADAIDIIINHPVLQKRINPEMTIKELLRFAEYDDGEIQRFLDVSESYDQELIGEAESAIQEILAGGKPDVNRQANTGFIKHILDFATDNKFSEDEEQDREIYRKLVIYAQLHLPIAQENAQRKAIQLVKEENLRGGADIDEIGEEENQELDPDKSLPNPDAPLNSPEGTQKRVQEEIGLRKQ